jgi:hypothetical protein
MIHTDKRIGKKQIWLFSMPAEIHEMIPLLPGASHFLAQLISYKPSSSLWIIDSE